MSVPTFKKVIKGQAKNVMTFDKFKGANFKG